MDRDASYRYRAVTAKKFFRYNGVMDDARRLLLIDDDRDLGDLMVDFLAQHGFEATIALNGSEGLGNLMHNVFGAPAD
jgi:ActR/RegA family two-component response regulator